MSYVPIVPVTVMNRPRGHVINICQADSLQMAPIDESLFPEVPWVHGASRSYLWIHHIFLALYVEGQPEEMDSEVVSGEIVGYLDHDRGLSQPL
ncbi:hypothetical protein LIER_33781 [Lithospermum erythrorhizon]|uniref:Uncharacterized protein n=1 Tax=Lithospermum erythrorhizon TaxID=34254 RepID=A0AAV3RXN2_LITER